MWKNWNPFRRKEKDKSGENVKQAAADMFGKENERLHHDALVRIDLDEQRGDRNNSSGESSTPFEDAGSMHARQRRNAVTRQHSLRSRTGMGVKNQLNISLPTSQLNSSRRITRQMESNFDTVDHEGNKTFSGVHGPLLSSPIVPQIRRALESKTGVSPRGKLLTSGKVGRSASLNYGNSSSLTRSTAGQVPWVRLKRRESIGLSDLVSGKIHQSPNTVKLAPREPRRLPAPPSFKTTPVIVTTEPSRVRVVDTQTVVSALREKRKRFGGDQSDDTPSEVSWQSSVKRRRQDSSQSNASSVSIPPMPDSLPDLMNQTGSSLLHIESLSSQRPSTVPATVDPYVNSSGTSAAANAAASALLASRNSRFVGGGAGLGGTLANTMTQPPLAYSQSTATSAQSLSQHPQPPPPFYAYPPFPLQPHHQPQMQQQQLVHCAGASSSNTTIRNVNNSKSVLRSIQSSLSSSMRSRVNAAALQQQGVDLKRIRGNKEDNFRRLSFSSDVSMGNSSLAEEPVQKASKQTTSASTEEKKVRQTAAPDKNTSPLDAAAAPQSQEARNESSVSTPTKRKIAEGVMLRKQNLSMSGSNSPARPVRALPASSMVSTDDFESDRRQEYRRRVLEMLEEDEGDDKSDNVAATNNAVPAVSNTTLTTGNDSSTTPTPSINASLASLSKLVQSATSATPVTTSETSAPNSLSQLLQSNDKPDGKPNSSAGALSLTVTGKPVASPSSDDQTKTASAAVTTTSSSLTSGFQVNFGAAISSASTGFTLGKTPTSTSSAALEASSTTTAAAPPSGFNFSASTPQTGGGITVSATSASPSSNANIVVPAGSVSQAGTAAASQGFQFSMGGAVASAGQTTTVNTIVSPTATSTPAHGLGGGFNFSVASSAGATLPSYQLATAPGNSGSTALASRGFNFGESAVSLSSTTTATASQPAAASSGFSFGGMNSSVAATSGSTAGFGFGATSTPTVSSSVVSPSTTIAAPTGFGGFAASVGLPTFGATSMPLSATTAAANTGGPVSTGLFPAATTLSNSTTSFPASASVFGAATGLSSTVSQATSNLSTAGSAPSFNFSGALSGSKPFTFGGATSAEGTRISTQMAGTVSNPATTFGAPGPAGGSIFGSSGLAASTTLKSPGHGIISTTGTGFGATPQQTITPTASVFGVGSTPGFGASSTSTTTGSAATFVFGGNTAAGNLSTGNTGATHTGFGSAQSSSVTSAFGSTLSNTSASAFGTTQTTTAMPVFGSTLSTAAAPAFGSQLTNTATPAFGSTQTTSAMPVFGSVMSNTAPPAFGAGISSGTPAFGSSTLSSNTTASVFGGSSGGGFGAAAKPVSLFGASATASAPSAGNQPSVFGSGSTFGSNASSQPSSGTTASPFVFGAGSQQQPSSTTTNSSQPFSFGGGSSATASQSIFGSGAGTSSTPFGQSAGSMFGASASGTKPPAFGASGTGAPAFGASSNTSNLAAPAFGASSNTSNMAAPTFGSNLSSPPAFGSTSSTTPAPAFGTSAGAPAFGSSQSKPPAFGSTSVSPAPAFGATGFGTNSLFNAQPASHTGATPSTTGTFGGGSNMFGAAAKPIGFGSGASAPPGLASPAFNFTGNQPQPPANTFGSKPGAAGSPFAFGQPQSPAGGGFNFTAPQSAARPSFPTPGTPAVGGGGFNFAAAAGASPSFNFSAGVPSANMFTPPPGSTPRPRAANARRITSRKGGRR